MALDEVAAEAAVGPERAFEVDEHAAIQRSKCGDPQRFRTEVGLKLVLLFRNDRQADAVHGHAVARCELGCERRANTYARASALRLALDNLTNSFNEAGEHILRSTRPARAFQRARRKAQSERTAGRSGTGDRLRQACAV